MFIVISFLAHLSSITENSRFCFSFSHATILLEIGHGATQSKVEVQIQGFVIVIPLLPKTVAVFDLLVGGQGAEVVICLTVPTRHMMSLFLNRRNLNLVKAM